MSDAEPTKTLAPDASSLAVAPIPTAPTPVVGDPTKVAAIQRQLDISDTAQITAFGERAQRDVGGLRGPRCWSRPATASSATPASCSAT
jgi:hypothetical protein